MPLECKLCRGKVLFSIPRLPVRSHTAISSTLLRTGNYSLMMASGLYKDQIDAMLQNRKEGSREGIYTISGAEFDEYSVTPVAYDPISETRLYRIRRNP